MLRKYRFNYTSLTSYLTDATQQLYFLFILDNPFINLYEKYRTMDLAYLGI